ncbi:MAG: M15 family metallopeptidase [Roseibium sp.]
MKLTTTSLKRLKGVHPDLVRIVKRAAEITQQPFQVTEGLRSLARQRQLVRRGASKTLNSRHLSGHAVDVVAKVGPRISWEVPLYYAIADAMKQAATELGIAVEWGGDWRSFFDGPHFQLPWKTYPKSNNPALKKPAPDITPAACSGASSTTRPSPPCLVDMTRCLTLATGTVPIAWPPCAIHEVPTDGPHSAC